jgi:hypothetical protein
MSVLLPNIRIKLARCACPTHNGEAPLFAAYAGRYVSGEYRCSNPSRI